MAKFGYYKYCFISFHIIISFWVIVSNVFRFSLIHNLHLQTVQFQTHKTLTKTNVVINVDSFLASSDLMSSCVHVFNITEVVRTSLQ